MTDTDRAFADVSTLAAGSWRLFRARFGPLMLVAGLGCLATLFCALAPLVAAAAAQALGPTGPLPWILAVVVGLSAALWAGTWGQVAVCELALAPEGEEPTFGAAVRRAWSRVAAFSWVCLLYLLIVGGGLFLFVVPGLYLGAALIFAPLIALEEGLTGVAALERSLDYTRGRMGPLAGRLAILGAVGGLPSVVPLVGPILGALLSPLPLVGLALLYHDARRAPLAPERPGLARLGLALAAAAWLFPVYVASRVVPAVVARWPEIRAQADRFASLDPEQAQKVLEALESGTATPETALPAAPSTTGAVGR